MAGACGSGSRIRASESAKLHCPPADQDGNGGVGVGVGVGEVMRTGSVVCGDWSRQTMQSKRTQVKTLKLYAGVSRSRFYEGMAATAQMTRQPLWTSPSVTLWSSEPSSYLSLFFSLSLAAATGQLFSGFTPSIQQGPCLRVKKNRKAGKEGGKEEEREERAQERQAERQASG